MPKWSRVCCGDTISEKEISFFVGSKFLNVEDLSRTLTCGVLHKMIREKRQYTRAQVGYPVLLKNSQGLMVGRVTDISPGGAFICCQEPLDAEEVITLTIRISPMSPPLKVKGEVIRSNIYCLEDETMCHGLSVRFTKISDNDRRVISSLISAMSNENQREEPTKQGRLVL